MSKINKVTEATREKLKRKSVLYLPNNPSAAGIKPAQLKEYFYELITGKANSVLSEIDRLVEEMNAAIGEAAAGAELSTLIEDYNRLFVGADSRTSVIFLTGDSLSAANGDVVLYFNPTSSEWDAFEARINSLLAAGAPIKLLELCETEFESGSEPVKHYLHITRYGTLDNSVLELRYGTDATGETNSACVKREGGEWTIPQSVVLLEEGEKSAYISQVSLQYAWNSCMRKENDFTPIIRPAVLPGGAIPGQYLAMGSVGYEWATPPGQDGKPVWVRYSASEDGSDFVVFPSDETKFIGFAIAATAPSNKDLYTWSRYVGKEPSQIKIEGMALIITWDDGSTATIPINTEECAVVEENESFVESVNGKTGRVTISKTEVGLSEVDNTRQYSAKNPPPYPVSSVNGKSGKVVLSPEDMGIKTAPVTLGKGAAASEGQTIVDEYAVAVGHSASATGASTAVGGATKSEGQSLSGAGVAIGYNAEAGVNDVAFGFNARARDNSNPRGIENSVALGANAQCTRSDEVVIGNDNTQYFHCAVAPTLTSDERDKADISPLETDRALKLIKEIRPIQYVRNERSAYVSASAKRTEQYRRFGLTEYNREAWSRGAKKGQRKNVGVSAQQVEQALRSVYGSTGEANIVDDNFYLLRKRGIEPEGVENKLSVNYIGLIPFLIGAVQELSQRIETLEDKLSAIGGKK